MLRCWRIGFAAGPVHRAQVWRSRAFEPLGHLTRSPKLNETGSKGVVALLRPQWPCVARALGSASTCRKGGRHRFSRAVCSAPRRSGGRGQGAPLMVAALTWRLQHYRCGSAGFRVMGIVPVGSVARSSRKRAVSLWTLCSLQDPRRPEKTACYLQTERRPSPPPPPLRKNAHVRTTVDVANLELVRTACRTLIGYFVSATLEPWNFVVPFSSRP